MCIRDSDGVAYRFYTTVASDVTVQDEVAEFNFLQGYTAYLPYTTKDVYKRQSLR